MAQQHAAFYISNNGDKHQLIDALFKGEILEALKGLHGELFSDLALDKLIAEEIRHDQYGIATGNKKSLQKYSEGEKKKLLLEWIINQHPDFIVVDNIFDHLDVDAQASISETLQSLADTASIIQIANRKADFLSFISDIFVQDRNGFSLYPVIEAASKKKSTHFMDGIPDPVQLYPEFKNPIIAFRNVNVSYNGRSVVKNICWRINKGDFWQLKGPNGAGKSTLLSLINGHNPKAYGQDITLFGVKKGSGESIWDIRQKIGYFSSDMTRQFSRSDSVERMLISGFLDSIGLYVTPTDLQIERAGEWARLLHMQRLKKTSFQRLSFGQQHLVLLARAMVKHPPLLILDEPTIGLDDENVLLFNELINKISAETSTSIIFVSHRKEEGLNPKQIFELIPGDDGSAGKQTL